MKTIITKKKVINHYPNQKNKKGRVLHFESVVNCKATEIWKLYQKPSSWINYLKPQAILVPNFKNADLNHWNINQSYPFTLYMYGFIPFGNHHILFKTIDTENFRMQSRERGFMVSHWDNCFEVIPLSATSCSIKDILMIESSGINSIVAWYAIAVLKSKHKKLIKQFSQN